MGRKECVTILVLKVGFWYQELIAQTIHTINYSSFKRQISVFVMLLSDLP